MANSNLDRVERGLDAVRSGLIPYVEQELTVHLGPGWLDELTTRREPEPSVPVMTGASVYEALAGRQIAVAEKPAVSIAPAPAVEPLLPDLERDASGVARWTASTLLRLMVETWDRVFHHTLGSFELALARELRTAQERAADARPFTSDDTYRVLDSAERLLRAVSATEPASDVSALRNELQRTVFAEQARHKTRRTVAVEGQPQSGLSPWREIVTPHPDVASGRYMQAEFAADLAQVHKGEGSDEYREPLELFRRTFVTAGLHELLVGALLRLSGRGSDPVVELQTNFGGGKTHSLLALYHLFGGTPSSQLPGLEGVLAEAEVDAAPTARRAVLVGTALSPGQASTKPDGTVVRTLWGEMAWQLGRRTGYELLRASDESATSPGSDLLVELFRRCSPCLVLLDEWVAYARQLVHKRDLPAGTFESQASFVQALTEAAKAVDSTLVVASIPSTKIEIGGSLGEFAVDALKNVFSRVAKPWRPANADEGFEIVRRRLFEPVDASAAPARDAAIDAFFRLYRNGGSFPPECGQVSYRRKLEVAYPIHPELFDRLYTDWSTLDKFQRTRGILRLMAKVIHRLWEDQDGGLLIMPSSVPLDDIGVKSELTRYLQDVWEAILSSEVDGSDSLAMTLDRGNANLGRYSACRRVSRTLYLGTAPASRGKNPGIDDRRVRLGCCQPGEVAATFGDALRYLSDRGRHIHQDGNRYWISTKPNLNRMAEEEAHHLREEPELLFGEIVRELQADRQRGDFSRVHTCPEDSGMVPDDPEARLVVLRPQLPHRKGQPSTPALEAAGEILESRGASPRLNRNALVFLAADKDRLQELQAAVASRLAWSSIYDRREALNLDSFQRNQAREKQHSWSETVAIRLRETWVHALVPRQESPTSDMAWDQHRVNGTGALAVRTSRKLVQEELLFTVMGAERLRFDLDRYLWKDGVSVSVGRLWEYFPRYLYLPRLATFEVLEAAVESAASLSDVDKGFATAARFNPENEEYLDVRLGRKPASITSSTLLVKPEVARPHAVDSGAGNGSGDSGLGTKGASFTLPVTKRLPTLFIGSVDLDVVRLPHEVGMVAEEVLTHLASQPGAKARLTLEIEIETPGGVTADVVRTISENCNTLKFKEHHFE